MMSCISFHDMTCRIPYRIGMFLLGCDCEMVRGHCMCTYVGSSPCKRYSLLGVTHPLWEKYFKCRTNTGGQRSSKAVIMKKTDM